MDATKDTKDTKPVHAENQGSVSSDFVSSWLSISGLGTIVFTGPGLGQKGICGICGF